ncbi:MAG: hypothetical protein Q7R43_01690 [Candidatus Daviesbacteria bacterium]|nr:hypothetical protein [Candidatus Daviesbacteria bacterium]
MKIKDILYKNLTLLLIPLVTLIIIFSWFKEGKIISNNSEENLDIYYSQASAIRYQTVWLPIGTGFKSGFSVPKYPTFAILGILEEIGVSASLRQAILLSVFMLIGMLSMYLLMKRGLNFNYPVSLIGSIFYNLNIYSMTQIWKRFLYAHMFAWAFLPLFLFLWFKWIDTKKIVWLCLFLISSLFFAYAFSNPVFLMTFWIPAALFSLERIWTNRKEKSKSSNIFIVSLIGFFLWAFVNIWWLYSTLMLGASWNDQVGQTWEADFRSLQAVSQSFPLNEVLLLRQSWYLGHGNDFFDFYHNFFIYCFSLIILLLVIFGLVKSKGHPFRKYFIVLAGVGLLVSKGTSFPFGYTFFHFLFSNFSLTTALRNSYEKFGIVWLLPYTIFFAIGFYQFSLRFKSIFRNLFLILGIFLFCGLLVYPMWSGDIFPPRHRLNLPNYYIEANNFLNSQKTERKFHIPFLLEVNPITYDWGYHGIDPSANIFDSEDLSTSDVLLYNKIFKLLPGFFDNKNVSNIFGLLGIQYIVFQRDIVYPTLDFVKTQKQIESWKGINKDKTFGKLDLYFLDPKIVKPRIYSSGNMIKNNSLTEALNLVASEEWDEASVFTLSDIGISLKDSLAPQISYNKVSQTEYLVSIRENTEPYILILNNTYDESWKAKIDGQIVDKHFIVNGFANGWILDKKGSYEVDIKLVVWPWD